MDNINKHGVRKSIHHWATITQIPRRWNPKTPSSINNSCRQQRFLIPTHSVRDRLHLSFTHLRFHRRKRWEVQGKWWCTDQHWRCRHDFPFKVFMSWAPASSFRVVIVVWQTQSLALRWNYDTFGSYNIRSLQIYHTSIADNVKGYCPTLFSDPHCVPLV
jgi:hypothetical protein